MKKSSKKKNLFLAEALRQGTVIKEAKLRFPVADDGRVSITKKVVMVQAPSKGIANSDVEGFNTRIDAILNDKDGIRLTKSRNKNGDATEIEYLNDGDILIVITKNFKKLFTSDEIMNCIMALNAAIVYYTTNCTSRTAMSHATIEAKVCKFLVLVMGFRPITVKKAYDLCDKRHSEARYKYCKELYKGYKKGLYNNPTCNDIDDLVTSDDDGENYVDEGKAVTA